MRTSPRHADTPPEIDPVLDAENGEFDFSGLPRGLRHPETVPDPEHWFEVTDDEHARLRHDEREARPAEG